MTKEKLITNLQGVLYSFYWLLGTSQTFALLPKEIWPETLNFKDYESGEPRSIEFRKKMLEGIDIDSRFMTQIIKGSETMIRRIFLSTTFELVEEYSKRTRQEQLLKSEPWYLFAKKFRDLASHHLDNEPLRWPDDLKKQGIAELRWRTRVITQGTPANKMGLSIGEILDLRNEIFTFVRERLA
jgi:hypothetical protein